MDTVSRHTLHTILPAMATLSTQLLLSILNRGESSLYKIQSFPSSVQETWV